MKNLYPKGKGKVHPSPGSPSGGGGGGPADVQTVLKLLPAVILALTAVLGPEDKEVLAYLILRSKTGGAAADEERRRCRRPPAGSGAHRAAFNCDCFDCYTSFWSRWDCSPEHQRIHQVIEAFEEHLASRERDGGQGRRNKGKKGKNEQIKKKPESEDDAVEKMGVAEAAADGGESVAGEKAEEDAEEEQGGGGGTVEDKGEDDINGSEIKQQAVVVGGERRKGWPDVMGLLNPRFWSLWGPGV